MPGNSSGIALVIVLWVTVLLTVMAGGFVSVVRTEAVGTANFRENLRAYWLARSGLNVALGRMLEYMNRGSDGRADDERERWLFDGRPYTVPVDDGLVRVRIMDEGGKWT